MYVRVADVRLHYEISGSGDPVLLIHGFPLTSRMWQETVGYLPDGFQYIMPDLRGFGDSQACEAMSIGRYAADLVELLARLEVNRPVILVGLSMGGYIAFEMVRALPGRVRALILANSRASEDTPDQAQARRATAARVIKEGMAGLAEEMAEKLFSPAASEELRAEWRDIMSRISPIGAAAALHAMADRDESFSTLRGFDRPLLAISGSDDRVIPVAESRAIPTVVPHARVEVIADAGHLTPVEQPVAFAKLVAEFVRTEVV
jgi:3-oxoadipate enol-lactonase